MPKIEDPQVARFCNEDVRPMADAFCSAYRAAKAFVADWSAKGIGSLVPDDNTQQIVDGAVTGTTLYTGTPDGRTPITAHDVNRMLAVALKVIQHAEETNPDGSVDALTLAKVRVNG
ncbi:MAG: hypothetical protein M3315_01110 [Actinomycetota bacterium]|nr:hypothetical protein [Actinomycetota bacterium]